jgi:hypothetical protein
LQLDRGLRELERLHVRVGGDKLNACHVGLDHAIHGIAAAAAYADHLDAGTAQSFLMILNAHFTGFIFLGIYWHLDLLELITGCEDGAQFRA